MIDMTAREIARRERRLPRAFLRSLIIFRFPNTIFYGNAGFQAGALHGTSGAKPAVPLTADFKHGIKLYRAHSGCLGADRR